MSQNLKKIYEFPLELQVKGKIYDAEVDKFHKCVYVLHKTGIFRKCYFNQKELDKQFELVVSDSNILAIEIDPTTYHLYYYDKNSIAVLHTRLFTRMTIFRTDHLIYYVKLDVKTDQLYVSYIEKIAQTFLVVILTTSGDEIQSFEVEEIVQDIIFYDKTYLIYTESKLLEVDLNNKIDYLERNLQTKIKMIEYENKYRFITSHGIKLEPFLFFGNVKKSNYETLVKSCMS
ncbi:hypothetical protein RF11_16216 [Thelohanellus kitauei]|uniref:Uncharacterized protein n=1 Tax=Thelohanellus kitauei TaxID=669202 RepID=A0A0C2J0G7_THEKT|nr:hypothetical protein RF11_16216 [Thelohanellus kitauei]